MDAPEFPPTGAEKPTLIATLGAVPRVGSLYNAHRGEFVHGNLFAKGEFWHPDKGDEIRAPFLTKNRDRSLKSDYFFTMDADDKMNKIDVSAELKLNVMSGLATVSGSGAYLSDKRKSNKTISCTFQEHVATGYDQVNLSQHGLEVFVDLNSITDDVTHVVYYVERGINVLVDLQYEMDSDYDNMEVRGKAEADIKEIISAKGSVEVEQKSDLKNERMRFNVFADLEPPANLAPTTIGEAMELAQKVPQLIEPENEGVPLRFRLIGVQDVLKKFASSVVVDTIVNSIRKKEVQKVAQMFKTCEKQMAVFNDFFADMEICRGAMGEEKFAAILNYHSDVQVAESELKIRLAAVLPRIRSFRGTEEKSADAFAAESVNDIVEFFETSRLSKKNVDRFKTTYSNLLVWAAYFRELQTKKIPVIRSTAQFDKIIMNALMRDPFPLYTFFFSIADDILGEELADLLDAFDALCQATEPANKEVYAVCIDELPDLQEREGLPNGSMIAELRKGKLVPYRRESTEDVNVLLLGTVLSGKSTFVNCLDYYLNAANVEQLDELPVSERIRTRALDRGSALGQPESLTKPPHLSCGDISPNEVFTSRMETVTQTPRPHYYFVKDKNSGKMKRLCLIDTPGLAYWTDEDARRKIADFIANIENIHQVLIFPYNSILWPMDDYYLGSLAQVIAMLPKSVMNRLCLMPKPRSRDEDSPFKFDSFADIIDSWRYILFQEHNSNSVDVDTVFKGRVYPIEFYSHIYKVQQTKKGAPEKVLEFVTHANFYEEFAERIVKMVEMIFQSTPFPGKLISDLEFARRLVLALQQVIETEHLTPEKTDVEESQIVLFRDQLANYIATRAHVPALLPSKFLKLELAKGTARNPELSDRQIARARSLHKIIEEHGNTTDCTDEDLQTIFNQFGLIPKYNTQIAEIINAY